MSENIGQKKSGKHKKNSRAAVKKNISLAVDHIPELISGHTRENTRETSTHNQPLTGAVLQPPTRPAPNQQQQKKSRIFAPPSQELRKKKQLLWSGVICFTAMILILWFVNIRGAISDISAKPSSEQAILHKTESDTNDILSSMNKNQPAKDATVTEQSTVQHIQNTLGSIFSVMQTALAAPTSTTATSSAIDAASVSTKDSTTTISTTTATGFPHAQDRKEVQTKKK